jgi:hypothetical protein
MNVDQKVDVIAPYNFFNFIKIKMAVSHVSLLDGFRIQVLQIPQKALTLAFFVFLLLQFYQIVVDFDVFRSDPE